MVSQMFLFFAKTYMVARVVWEDVKCYVAPKGF